MTKVQRRRRRVGAPAAVVPALKQVVSDARQDGIDLKIVVIGKNPPVDTPLHDIATEVGRAYPGSTALVLSPSYAGTYSPTFDRITLEVGPGCGQDRRPRAVVEEFVNQLSRPTAAMTVVLVLAGMAATVATRIL